MDDIKNAEELKRQICAGIQDIRSFSEQEKEEMRIKFCPEETTTLIDDFDHVCTTVDANYSANKIADFWIVIFIVVGIFGNIISSLVFSKKSLIRFSSTVYLKWLAVTDSLYLLTVLTSHILSHFRCFYFRSLRVLDIFNYFEWICKVFQFNLDFLSDFSICIVMCFTVERFLAVYKPHFYRTTCTSTRATKMCKCLFFVIFCSDFPAHAFLVGFSEPNTRKCSIISKYEDTFYILYATENMAFKVIPVIATAILNILIVFRLTSSNRNAHQDHERGMKP